MKKNDLIQKLKSRKGESLPEVLIAVLIVAMGIVMLGTLLNVSSRMVEKGQAKVGAIYSEIAEMDQGISGNDNSVESFSGLAKINFNNGIQNPADVVVNLFKGDNLISYGPESNMP